MFERFRRSRGTDASTGAVATREPEASTSATDTADRDLDWQDERTGGTRFGRDDTAGGGAATAHTTLGRETARDDLARDEAIRDDEDAARHDEAFREDAIARDDAAARDDATAHETTAGATTVHEAPRDETATAEPPPSPGERDRGVSTTGAAGAGAAGAAGGAAAMHHHDREAESRAGNRTIVHDSDEAPAGTAVHDRGVERDRDGVDDRVGRHGPVLAPAALDTMRARQRDRFGGFQWGSDFFGWLCAIGLASLLTATLVGAGVALGLSTDDAANSDTAEQIGLGGGIALLAVLAVAWFSGGYVAGRMARFDGARQGVGVWLWTLLAAVVVALIAAIGGSEYDVFQRLNLPRIAIGDSTLNAGGAIAGAAAVVVTLLFAVIGGKVGERFHRRVDRVATDEYVVER